MARDLLFETDSPFPRYHLLPSVERGAISRKRRELRDQGVIACGLATKNPIITRVASNLWKQAKGRAEVKRIPFTITGRWVFDRILAGKCEMTGLPFVVGKGGRSNFSPSLDKNVAALGYTPENCRVVIWGYNSAKACGTDEDVLRMAEALVRHKALKNGPASA